MISAYESATTQTARSLGRSGVTQRRGQKKSTDLVDADPLSVSMHHRTKPASTENLQQLMRKTQSTHSIFFGTDDIGTLKKEEPKPVKDDGPLPEERTLAYDVFEVYFSTDDTHAEIGKARDEKKQRILAKINGTMPWLPGFLKEFNLPQVFTTLLLFTEASLRGIGQVYFQNNPLTGLFVLVAMFIQSTRVAVHGVVALVVGNLAGILMGFDKSFVSCGKYNASTHYNMSSCCKFEFADTLIGHSP